ncbi:hypothetical protein CYMTET_31099 [Cymbomonas tetramitiformis]|uniref:Uncharacterized protein n=1 Tax=Cymbomonas tetramitiformis TaxID=36881 RepID=A0AAE0KTB0_9CHLO|nr:hypothetical protein CYMTET_31099 [Cymbomonas tetramitiformis]
MGSFVIEKANGEDEFMKRYKRARDLQSKRKMVSLQRTVATTVGNAISYVDGWHENGSNMRVVSYGRGPGKLQKPKDKNAGLERLWAAKARHEKRIPAAHADSKIVVEKRGGPAKTAYTKLGHQEMELSKARVQERQIAFAKELIKRKERSKDRRVYAALLMRHVRWTAITWCTLLY